MNRILFPEQTLIYFKKATYFYKEVTTYNNLNLLRSKFLSEEDTSKRNVFRSEIVQLHTDNQIQILESYVPVFVVKNMDDCLFNVLYREQVGFIVVDDYSAEDDDDSITEWRVLDKKNKEANLYIDNKMKEKPWQIRYSRVV
jgi:hypothetical protein